MSPMLCKDRTDCGSALHSSRSSRAGMNNVTTATSFPSLCRHDCQHGRKCEAQEASWSRTNTQREAWLRPRPRITGRSAEKLVLIGRTSACWMQSRTESTEGGAMYRLRRFLKKNVLIQDVGAGLITMSYLGNAGWRSKRASTACIAALPSEMPFW
jgi:hypothetical protein